MNSEIAAYCAGLIDGEGCISMGTVKTKYTIFIAVVMTEEKAVRFLKKHYEGSLMKRQRKHYHKPIWAWRVYARKAETCLRSIYPYLLVKKEQASVCLQMRDHLQEAGSLTRGPIGNRNVNKDEEILAFRKKLKSRITELNRKGVKK